MKKLYEDKKSGIRVLASSRDEAKQFIEEKKHCVYSMATVIKSQQYNVLITADPDVDHIGEPYFKFYNNASFDKASKIARISFLEPKYIHHKNARGHFDDWVLNSKERKLLVELLTKKVSHFKSNGEKMTGWEYAISQFNNEKGYEQEDTENNLLPNKLLDDSVAFNLPMPDYTKLQ